MDSETVAKIRAELSGNNLRRGISNDELKAQKGGAIPMSDMCGFGPANPVNPRTSAEQIIVDIAYREQRVKEDGDKAKQALDFFESNPEFAEFIALVRSGAVQF